MVGSTDLQFAMLMFADVKVKHDDNQVMSYEVKFHESIFQDLSQKTSEYMVRVSGKETLTEEQKEFFSHIFFDYTNGFYGN
jgi:hypothetical protein